MFCSAFWYTHLAVSIGTLHNNNSSHIKNGKTNIALRLACCREPSQILAQHALRGSDNKDVMTSGIHLSANSDWSGLRLLQAISAKCPGADATLWSGARKHCVNLIISVPLTCVSMAAWNMLSCSKVCSPPLNCFYFGHIRGVIFSSLGVMMSPPYAHYMLA